jgi:RHS repeat-associated protein
MRADGTQEDNATYFSRDPYGGLIGASGTGGSMNTETGFTGASTPNGSGGFVYLRNRWYDPQTGRFLTQDPIGLAGGVNLYSYAGNNPINFDDPFGLCPFCDVATLVTSAAVGVANWWNGLSDQRRETLAWSLSQSLAAVAEERGARSGRRLAAAVSSSPRITEAYRRPVGATTAAQRAYVQGQPCVVCGASSGKRFAGHKKALVKEYYETGSVDADQMRSVDAVQAECSTCSHREGAHLSRYSKEKKKEHGLHD